MVDAERGYMGYVRGSVPPMTTRDITIQVRVLSASQLVNHVLKELRSRCKTAISAKQTVALKMRRRIGARPPSGHSIKRGQ